MGLSARQLFQKHIAFTNDAPLALEIERAKGSYLFDKEGKSYLDLISGISVSNMGHSHPKIVEAVQDQAAKHMHVLVYGELIQNSQTAYAKALTDHLPSKLNTVYYVSSGTEATEGALKLAKRATGRTNIISFKNSYHGSTAGALSAMGDEHFKQNYRPLIPGHYIYEYGADEGVAAINTSTAAVIVEPVQAESGIRVPPPDFLPALRAACDKRGCLLIFDEIQTGFGRTGHRFTIDDHGVCPDILLLAKALGGGMPLGAFIGDKHLFEVLQSKPILGHITTFGGHPVSCAAGLAAFDLLNQGPLLASLEAKGQRFEDNLSELPLGCISRKGIWMAIHFESFDFNQEVIKRCLDKGLLTDWFLFAPNALRIAPPLPISNEEIDFATEVILEVCHEMA